MLASCATAPLWTVGAWLTRHPSPIQHTVREAPCLRLPRTGMVSRRGQTPFGLVGLLLAITLVPLATLIWLGLKVLDQERILQRQQATQDLTNAADYVVSALQVAVSRTEQRVAAGATDWADGGAMVTFTSEGVAAVPRSALAYF